MPRERRESGGKPGDAGEGKGTSQDVEWAAEDLGDSLPDIFRHHITMHGDVFRACAVITQLTIKNGEPLFEVEYTD
jgi:hypothetical protein